MSIRWGEEKLGSPGDLALLSAGGRWTCGVPEAALTLNVGRSDLNER